MGGGGRVRDMLVACSGLISVKLGIRFRYYPLFYCMICGMMPKGFDCWAAISILDMRSRCITNRSRDLHTDVDVGVEVGISYPSLVAPPSY